VKDKEDVRSIVSELIADKGLGGVHDAAEAAKLIENCHRLSSKQQEDSDRPPGIIVRFHSRVTRQHVLRDAKKHLNRRNGINMVEDLIKQDHINKRLARPQMMAAYARGQRVAFIKGQLIIDGKKVAIQKPQKNKKDK